MKRHFEFVTEKHDKFWTIETNDFQLITRFGRNGTNGQMSVKEFDSKEMVDKAADKIIKSKIKKGYVEIEG